MDRNFIQIKLILPRFYSELLGNFLVENGCKGYIIEDRKEKVILKGFVKGKSQARVLVEKIKKYAKSLKSLLKKDFQLKVELKRIKEEDWSKNWRKSFKPIKVTDRIIIKPNWMKKRFPQKIVIELVPKMAFGTGEHPTTKMCLRSLENYIKPFDRILDLGCGSGILAIASAKLGASYVLALDIDQETIGNARENIVKNRVQRIVELREGTLNNDVPDRFFNLIVANLTKTEIMKYLKRMYRVLRKKGIFILSGIQTEEKKEIEKELCSEKIRVCEASSEQGWVCLVAKKSMEYKPSGLSK